MGKFIPTILAAVSVFASTAAFADTITIDSVPGVKDSAGQYIGPYTGKFNGVSTTVFCDDLDHNIGIGSSATNVNVSTVSDLTLTRFGGAGATSTLANALVDYEKIFYLSTFLGASYAAPTTFYGTFSSGTTSANSTVNADIQDAMWSYFASSPLAANTGTNQVNQWLNQATANYTKFSYGNFRILTDSGKQYNGVQELFINTVSGGGLNPAPEPGTVGMLLGGVAAVALGLRRRNRQAAARL